jgi:hypothetical protein
MVYGCSIGVLRPRKNLHAPFMKLGDTSRYILLNDFIFFPISIVFPEQRQVLPHDLEVENKQCWNVPAQLSASDALPFKTILKNVDP